VLPPGSEGRSSRIIVSINGGSGIVAGSVANGEVRTSDTRTLVQIPVNAILNELDSEADVYVVVEGVARRRPVQIVSKTEELVMIASGLSLGDEVILRPPKNLHDGSPVSVQQGPGEHR
jgi:hypothetical protein